jgi:kynurenine formamidase
VVEPFTATCIPVEHLKQLIAEQNITFLSGDILFIRSGFTAAFNRLTLEEEKALPERPKPEFIGVESSKEMLQFLWDNQFSAVAGDTSAFERSPITGPHVDDRYILHEWLLGGWGMPIGEMFDLEGLSEMCKTLQRHTFFLSSMPLKVRA